MSKATQVSAENFDVLIEISPGQGPVKYEFCKESGFLKVDRFLQTSMGYPTNYGYIPNTLCDDGDPCDVMVLCDYDLQPGVLIEARAVGMLVMEDEAGLDNKILAVPVESVSLQQKDVLDISDINKTILDKIEHFFSHYKDLESTKWVKLQGWKGKEDAIAEIQKSIDAFGNE